MKKDLTVLIPYSVKDQSDFIRYLFVKKENKELKNLIHSLEEDIVTANARYKNISKTLEEYKKLLKVKNPDLDKLVTYKKKLRYLEYVTLKSYKEKIERLENENIQLKIKLNEN